ncbi:MAG: nucleoside phosphorylase [Bacilli bacterium]|nr:nucleoside phosphorylase [Bacilli bacterium]
MSILNAYEEGGIPIISPDKLYKKERKIADVAVACFTKKALDYVLSTYRHETYHEFMATGNGPLTIYYLPDFKALFFMSLIGSSMAGGLLQEVAYISGATKFIYFGSCGVLDKSLRGHYIVPTESYREEGYSYHYAPPSEYMPIKNHTHVESFLRSLGVPIAIGKNWTTDAFYNETIAKWERMKGDGVLSVEMESSGLEAIADHLGVEFYTFFFAGDILGESWIPGDLGGERERRRQVSAVEVALALGRSIAK